MSLAEIPVERLQRACLTVNGRTRDDTIDTTVTLISLLMPSSSLSLSLWTRSLRLYVYGMRSLPGSHNLLPSDSVIDDKVQSWLVTHSLSPLLYLLLTMFSRTLPSLTRTLASSAAGSSRSSSTSYGLLARTQVGSIGSTSSARCVRMYSTPSEPGAAPMDEGEKAIYEKLSAKFPGNRLEVQDVSGTSPCLSSLS